MFDFCIRERREGSILIVARHRPPHLNAPPCICYNNSKFLGSSAVEQPAVVMQLPRETVVATSGEFREAYPGLRNGNPERSLPKGAVPAYRVGRNVQRLEAEEPVPIMPQKRPTPLAPMRAGEEIVRA